MVDAHHLVASFELELEQEGFGVYLIVVDAIFCDIDDGDRLERAACARRTPQISSGLPARLVDDGRGDGAGDAGRLGVVGLPVWQAWRVSGLR